MKKVYTILLGAIVAMLCLTQYSYAQEGKIKIKITKEINGVRKTLEKEYRNEEEMKADPEYREMTGDKNRFNFHFSGDEEKEAYIEIEEFGDERGNSFFFFSDDEDAKQHIRILEGDDDGFHEEIEWIQGEMRRNMSEEMSRAEWEEMEKNLKALRDSEGDKYVYVIRSEKLKIVEVDGDEFGKNGVVEESKKLHLEDLSFSPNPSDGRFQLRFTMPKEEELTITVYNLEGKSVYNSYFERYGGQYRETIDLTNRNPGIYLLEVVAGKKRLTRKIVVD